MTSGHNLRSKERFDYKIFGDVGIKVPKMDDLIDEESKLSMKMTRFLNDYAIDLLFDIKEIEEVATVAGNLCEKYEEIHVRLRRGFGTEEYKKLYDGFDEKLKSILDWSREARA